MVSVLDSGSSGPGPGPGRGHCVVFFTLTVPLSTQVYKWVPVNLMLGVTLRWTSIPSRGCRNTPSRFMLQKPEITFVDIALYIFRRGCKTDQFMHLFFVFTPS